jgi:hypothetical protein
MEGVVAGGHCASPEFARAGDLGHGRPRGEHQQVQHRRPHRMVQIGGLGVDQRDDCDEFGGDRGPARSGSGFGGTA